MNNLYNKEQQIAEKALELAIELGADSARVSLNIGIQNSFSVLNDKLDRLQSANDTSLFIQLFCNGRYGSYSTNRLEISELKSFIGEAVKSTLVLSPDKFRSLPPQELYYKGGKENLEQFDPYILQMEPELKKKIAFDGCREIYGTNKKIVAVNSEYGDVLEYQYFIDSQGFKGETLQSNFSLSVECAVKGRSDSKPDGWWYESSMFYNNFSPLNVGKTALEKALKKLNAKRIASAKMGLVIDRVSASRVVSPILSALNGHSIQQKNSFLIDTLGKSIFPNKVSLIDTPHDIGMHGARYFDSEGIATKPISVIDKGIINTYFLNTYNANKLGTIPTIEGVSVPRFNLDGFAPEHRELTAEQMIPLMGRGVYVTGFNGGNCNGATGDFSFGVDGFYFENGEILYPVKELNISGNIISLWQNIAFIGNDARECTRWQIPSLSFFDVDFTGL